MAEETDMENIRSDVIINNRSDPFLAKTILRFFSSNNNYIVAEHHDFVNLFNISKKVFSGEFKFLIDNSFIERREAGRYVLSDCKGIPYAFSEESLGFSFPNWEELEKEEALEILNTGNPWIEVGPYVKIFKINKEVKEDINEKLDPKSKKIVGEVRELNDSLVTEITDLLNLPKGSDLFKGTDGFGDILVLANYKKHGIGDNISVRIPYESFEKALEDNVSVIRCHLILNELNYEEYGERKKSQIENLILRDKFRPALVGIKAWKTDNERYSISTFFNNSIDNYFWKLPLEYQRGGMGKAEEFINTIKDLYLEKKK